MQQPLPANRLEVATNLVGEFVGNTFYVQNRANPERRTTVSRRALSFDGNQNKGLTTYAILARP